MNPSTRSTESVRAGIVPGRRALNYVICTASLAAVGWSLTQAQGPLTPPGAPAPAMKTLQQIEPRTEVNSTTTPGDADSVFRITQPGSYYLSANLTGVSGKHGIEIAAHDVTLDLGGFALTGPAGSLSGIFVSGAFEHTGVRNGCLRGWGQRGIDGSTALNSHFEDLHLAGNNQRGLHAGTGSMILRCTSRANTFNGFELSASCSAVDCIAVSNAANGFSCGEGCTLSRCIASSNGSYGLFGGDSSTFNGCVAKDNGDIGLLSGSFSSIINCSAKRNQGTGIWARSNGLAGVGDGCTVAHCSAAYNHGDGIMAGTGSTLDNCIALVNDANGFRTDNNCTIRHCSARSNAANGIYCLTQSLILENNCTLNGTAAPGGAGIYVAFGQGTRVDGNLLAQNPRGIQVISDRNLIVRNSCRDNNSHNYVIAAGNRFAQIVVLTANAALDGDTPAGGATSTDPWANFTF